MLPLQADACLLPLASGASQSILPFKNVSTRFWGFFLSFFIKILLWLFLQEVDKQLYMNRIPFFKKNLIFPWYSSQLPFLLITSDNPDYFLLVHPFINFILTSWGLLLTQQEILLGHRNWFISWSPVLCVSVSVLHSRYTAWSTFIAKPSSSITLSRCVLIRS